MIYNTLQAQKKVEETRLLLQELQNKLSQQNFTNVEAIQLLKNQYLPMLADAYFFDAVLDFEAVFPVGTKAQQKSYIKEKRIECNHFFSGASAAIRLHP